LASRHSAAQECQGLAAVGSPAVHLAHARSGAGAPLVLLHGIGSHREAFAPVIPALAAHRTVWAVDLPGHGGSAPLSAEPPTIDALARAVRSFMAGCGVARFHVAGNSTGGGVALRLGRLGAAESVCALSPVGFTSSAELRYARASLRLARAAARGLGSGRRTVAARPGLRRLASAQFYGDARRVPPADFAAALEALAAAPGFDATLRWAVGEAYAAGDPPACPVTIAWAAHDRLLLTRPQARRAREALADARHVLLDGCGHVPMHDDPGLVARVLLEASAGSRPGNAGAGAAGT
jgi:pimeloyl-ACP methyl ester carboxylesterase